MFDLQRKMGNGEPTAGLARIWLATVGSRLSARASCQLGGRLDVCDVFRDLDPPQSAWEPSDCFRGTKYARNPKVMIAVIITSWKSTISIISSRLLIDI